jgi:hypothetical protein
MQLSMSYKAVFSATITGVTIGVITLHNESKKMKPEEMLYMLGNTTFTTRIKSARESLPKDKTRNEICTSCKAPQST